MVIAIDGPAGVGKTTISKELAKRANFFFVSSGEMYRAVTYLTLSSQLASPLDGGELLALIWEKGLTLNEKGMVSLPEGSFAKEDLHNGEIDSLVSTVAGLPEVRQWVNHTLQEWSRTRNIVVEGRDMSTTVFSNAELKIFLDASIQARTHRRAGERLGVEVGAIAAAIQTRDAHDQRNLNETFSSSEDSLYIDTSLLTISDVCESIFNKISKLISK